MKKIIKKIPKENDIVLNNEDTLSKTELKPHPNLIVKDDEELIGLSITHQNYEDDNIKLEITKDDIIKETHLFRILNKRKSYLTANKNKLNEDKYLIIGKAKPSLLERLINKLLKIK